MVANRYNAGTAYVSIVPVFGGNQKKIAEEMRKQFSKRSNYDALENGLRQAVQRGLKDTPAEIRDAMKRTNDRVVKDVERQAREAGKVTARTIKQTTDKEFGNYFVQLAKRGVKDLEKNLGGFKIRPGLSDDWVGVLRDIKRDVDVINKSFTEGGTRSAKRIEEAYERISASMERAAKLRAGAIGGIPKADAMSLRKAQEAFGPYSSAIADKKTLDEVRNHIKEQERLENERIKIEERSNRAREAEARRHLSAQMALAELERKQRAANLKALRRAEEEEAEASYRSAFGTAREQFEDPEKLGARGSRRQEAIARRQRETIERTRRSVQGLMNDLSRVSAAKFEPRFDGRAVRRELADINNLLGELRSNQGVGKRIRLDLDVKDAKAEAKALRDWIDVHLRDVNFDVDVKDADARRTLREFKAQADMIRDIDVNIDADVTELAYAHARLKQLALQAERDIRTKVKVDTNDADRDIARIRLAMDTLRDKRIGIDITHRDAMAAIATIRTGMASLRNKNVDIDIDVDFDRLRLVAVNAASAERRLRSLARQAKTAGVSFAESTQAFRVFNPLLAAVAFAGAPAISAIAGLTAAVGGLASILPGAAAGLAAIPFALKGVGEGLSAYTKMLDKSVPAAGGAARAVDTVGQAAKRAAISLKYGMMDAQRSYRNSLADIRDSSAESAAQIKRTFEDAVRDAREARRLADEATRSKFGDQRADANAAFERSRQQIQSKIDALNAELKAKEREVAAKFDDRTSAARQSTANKVADIRSTYTPKIDAARTAEERVRLTREMNERIAKAEKDGAEKLAQIEKSKAQAIENVRKAEQKKIQTQLQAIERLQQNHKAKLSRIDRERTQELEKNAAAEARAIAKANEARKRAEADAEADAKRARARARRQFDDAKERLAQQRKQTMEEAKLAAEGSAAVGGGSSAAATAMKEWREQMEKLGPEGVAFVKFLHEAGEELNDLQKRARKGFLPGLQDALGSILREYKGPFGDFLEEMGFQLGDISRRWGRLITSPSAAEWFGRVGKDASKYTADFALATENTARGLAGLVDAFRPFAYDISDWLVDATGRFDKWANSLASNPKFIAFMDAVKSTGPLIRETFAQIGELFVNLTIALEPFTVAILNAVNGALDFINALDPKILGAIVGTIGGVVAGIMVLSGVMAGAGSLAGILAGSMSTMFTKAATGLGAFVAMNGLALGAMAATDSASRDASKAFIHMGEAIGGIVDFGRRAWGVLGELFNVLEPMLPAVAELGASVLDLATGLGGGLLDVVSALVNGPLKLLVDMFTSLPTSLQGAILGFIPLATIVGKNRDIFEKFWLVFDSVSESVMDFVMKSGGVSGAFKALGDNALDAVTGGLNALGTSLGVTMPAATGAATTGLAGLRGALVALAPMVATVAAVGAAFTLLAFEAEKAEARSAEALDRAKAKLISFGDTSADVGASLDEFFSSEGKLGGMVGAIDGVSDALEALENDKFSEWVFSTGEAMADAKDKFEQMDKALADSVSSGNVDEAIKGYQGIAESARAAGWSYEELNEYLPGFIEQMQLVSEETRGTGLSSQELADLYAGKFPESLRTAMEGSDKYKDAMAGVKDETSQAEQATRDLMAAERDLAALRADAEDARLNMIRTEREFSDYMQEAREKGTLTLDENTEAGLKNREMLSRLADATMNYAWKQLEATGNVDDFVDTTYDQRESLLKTVKEMGLSGEAAETYTNLLLEIPPDVRTKSELRKFAENSAELDKYKNKVKETSKEKVVTKAKADTREAKEDLSAFQRWLRKQDWLVTVKAFFEEGADNHAAKERKKRKGRKTTTRRSDLWHDGGIAIPMAAGGLVSMPSVAQMVPPNTWRVVGDRMDVDEAFIPLDGSKRSKAILLEALVRMPGMFMHDGGIVQFAAGAVAAPTVADAPAAATGEGGDMSAVSAAFEALSAELTASWGSLLDALLARAEEFYVALTEATTGFTAAEIARWATFSTERLAADALFKSQLQLATETFLAAEAERHRVFMYGVLLPSTANAHGLLQREWGDHYSNLAARAGAYRSDQMHETQRFHDALMHEIHSFGSSARSGWSDIWSDLVSSAARIFGQLPPQIGTVLSTISGKMNTHIVDPYNKIVSDLDLKKELKIGRFPVQAHADGGMIAGYTPGRDVHTFVSPTGGILHLSGGEPVLRPEAGLVLGKDWVDGINAAARTGGTRGVRRFISQEQAYADGGLIQSFAKGGTLIDAANWWVRKGARGSRHSAFGGRVRSGHSKNSLHYVDRAVDLNYGPGGTSRTEQAFFNKHVAEFKSLFPKIRVIWMTKGHHDHMHIDTGKGADIGNFAGALGSGGYGDLYDIKGDVTRWLGDARKAISKTVGDGRLAGLATGLGEKLFTEIAEAKADEFMDTRGMMYGPAGDFKPGSGVARWRPEVLEALRILNQPTSDMMVNAVLRRMQQESGGNPRAINLWDINARRGHPSKGLMQVIDPTFKSYGHPGYKSNIWDPLSNILAGMRWSIYRYGSILGGFNRRGGYAEGTSGIDLRDLGAVKPLLRDRGGPLPQGYSLTLNNLGHEETVLPETTADVARLFTNVETALSDQQTGARDAVAFYDAKFYTDPQETAEAIERTRRMVAPPSPSFV